MNRAVLAGADLLLPLEQQRAIRRRTADPAIREPMLSGTRTSACIFAGQPSHSVLSYVASSSSSSSNPCLPLCSRLPLLDLPPSPPSHCLRKTSRGYKHECTHRKRYSPSGGRRPGTATISSASITAPRSSHPIDAASLLADAKISQRASTRYRLPTPLCARPRPVLPESPPLPAATAAPTDWQVAVSMMSGVPGVPFHLRSWAERRRQQSGQ